MKYYKRQKGYNEIAQNITALYRQTYVPNLPMPTSWMIFFNVATSQKRPWQDRRTISKRGLSRGGMFLYSNTKNCVLSQWHVLYQITFRVSPLYSSINFWVTGQSFSLRGKSYIFRKRRWAYFAELQFMEWWRLLSCVKLFPASWAACWSFE